MKENFPKNSKSVLYPFNASGEVDILTKFVLGKYSQIILNVQVEKLLGPPKLFRFQGT